MQLTDLDNIHDRIKNLDKWIESAQNSLKYGNLSDGVANLTRADIRAYEAEIKELKLKLIAD